MLPILVSLDCHNKISQTQGCLNNRNLVFHSSRDEKSEISSVPAWIISGENSVSGLQMIAFCLCLHMVFPLCREREKTSSVVSSQKDTNPPGLQPTILFYCTFLEAPLLNKP